MTVTDVITLYIYGKDINKSFNISRGLDEDCVSSKAASCSLMAGRKSSVSAPDLITQTFEWRALHSNQVTGTPDSRPDSYLKPPSSLSGTPPLPFVCLQAPINLQSVCLLMLSITTWGKCTCMHACMHVWLSRRVRWPEPGELGNRYL